MSNEVNKTKALAPVVIFLYNRPEHTRKMLEYLDKDKKIDSTELFIFCDGAKRDIDKPNVERVRQIVKEFQRTSRAKKVSISFSETNKGLAKSVISGVSSVLDTDERVIVLEDDILVDCNFLTYMNDALEFYKKCDNIWSITGYSFEMKSLKNYKHDVYYSYRGCSWSWGTWADRWKLVDWEVDSYQKDRRNLRSIIKFNRGGLDLFDMLTDQMEGRIDSWAVRWCYAQSKNNMYTIYPRYALISNIGCDGTGTHSGVTDKFVSNLKYNQDIKLEILGINKKIAREFGEKYGGNLTNYIFSKSINAIKKIVKQIIRK